MGHEMNILFKSSIIESVLFVHAQMVFKLIGCLLRRKVNIKFLLASFKTLTNSKYGSESHFRISVPAFLLCHWPIFVFAFGID
jgi:hypothetical protein